MAHSYVSPPGLNSVKSTVPVGGGDVDPKMMLDTLNVVRLIRSYQVRTPQLLRMAMALYDHVLKGGGVRSLSNLDHHRDVPASLQQTSGD